MKSSSRAPVLSSGGERVLVIMAKAPRPGAVKTRLAQSLSPEAVIDFYCCLLEDTLALARSLSDVEVAVMCPESDASAWHSWRETKPKWLRRQAKALPPASPRCSRTLQRVINDVLLPSTPIARIYHLRFSKRRSKRWPHMTWSSGQRTTAATISSGQRLLIQRFSPTTEWALVARWIDSWRAHELLSFP